MKPAWYEPNLCMCTPENPNTMGVCVTLTEPVNVEALRSAVERLRERFPYLYVRARVEGNNLIKRPSASPGRPSPCRMPTAAASAPWTTISGSSISSASRR